MSTETTEALRKRIAAFGKYADGLDGHETGSLAVLEDDALPLAIERDRLAAENARLVALLEEGLSYVADSRPGETMWMDAADAALQVKP
jgi:hypothetical protein